MRKYLLFVLSIFLLVSCSNEQTNSKVSKSDEVVTDSMEGEGEITQETMDYFRKQAEEEAANRVPEGTFTSEKDIENNLREFLTYYTPDASKNVVFESIGTDSTGRYTKPCDYDYVGSVKLNFTGDDYYHTITINGTTYLTLSLEYEESALYIIKELKITDKGKKLWVKANYLTHWDDTDGSAEINPQVYDMEFILTDDDQVVFTDRPGEHPRYFMLKDEIKKLPDPDCDPDYH